MATIKEVAKLAGVSVGTVSNVLSEAVPVSAALRDRVWSAIRHLDFHPNHVARSLKIRQTKMLGMVISDITNPFFPLVVRGAEDMALQHGFVVVTFNTDDQVKREEQVLSLLRARRVDGLLLVIAPSAHHASHIEAMIKAGTPVVCLDRIPEKIDVDSVSVDSVKGARMCVQHLLIQGHTRIGMITGSMALQTARERLEGYRVALRDARIKGDPGLIAEGDFRAESGYQLGKQLLLRRDPPTAIFSANGMMTLGVLRAVEELGLHCPEDIAIATFDDLPVAEVFRPHLTAVAQPAYAMGSEGAKLLIGRIGEKKRGDTLHLKLDPELIVRESTSVKRSKLSSVGVGR